MFRGPWQGAVADVIELLNRDYPRVIGCGDTETGRSFFAPISLFRCNLSPSFSLMNASTLPCLKHCESKCVSLFVFGLFFPPVIASGTKSARTCFFFPNRTCVVHGESREKIKVEGDTAEKENLEVLGLFYTVICSAACRDVRNAYKIMHLS